MPRGEFKHRYWFFAAALNIGRNVSVIWKDLLLSSDSYRLLKYRGGCTIPWFQISVRCEKCVAARHYAVICKQLLNANDINRVRWVVLELLQDGACTDFFENLRENSLKRDLSNATTFNPPLFSLVDTFKNMYTGHGKDTQLCTGGRGGGKYGIARENTFIQERWLANQSWAEKKVLAKYGGKLIQKEETTQPTWMGW
jgi:hypothetical protein